MAFDLAHVEVGELRERLERREIGARGAVLQDHVEEVAADDADHRDQPVEQRRNQHAGKHPGHDETLDRRDAEHLHGVDLVADLARAEVGADGRAARARDEQRGHDRAGLTDDREHRGSAGVGLGADLRGEIAELQRDDGAERDRDQHRRQDRHAGDEPGLIDEFLQLERPFGKRPE